MLKLNQADVAAMKARLTAVGQAKQELAMRVLNSIASDIVTMAKTDPSGFTDRTGNLRNSIGYLPAFRGKAADVTSTSETKEDESGKSVKQTTYHAPVSGKGNTISVVVFAGMEYAVYVEFTEGHFVIGGAWSAMLGRVRDLFISRMRAAVQG